jgi:hypothetical protein
MPLGVIGRTAHENVSRRARKERVRFDAETRPWPIKRNIAESPKLSGVSTVENDGGDVHRENVLKLLSCAANKSYDGYL